MMVPKDLIIKSNFFILLLYFHKCKSIFSFVYSDGTTQLLSGCLRDFRNKPFPTRARIEYYQNTLTVLFHNGMTNNNDDYEMCMRAEGVVLPKNGYFGVSAATGGLADDHDVFHFLTTSLHDPSQLAATEASKINEADQMKLAQEYEDYQKKLNVQKEEYRKEHPDENKPSEPEDWFETDNQRELRQIYQSQKQMLDHIRDLSSKMDEVVGRQERTMGLLSANANGVVQQHTAGGATGGGIELGTVLSNQNVYMASVREIRAIVGELQNRADTILQNQVKQPTAQIHSAGYDVQSIMSEMRDGMNQVKQGIALISNK